jgi:16S rRNA (adenine1518-N6/adenine1519-N6)-dimethyltransferase
VTAIEIDRDLAAELAPRVPSNVEIVVRDVIDVDLSDLLASGPVRVAGNLPYNISSPILFKLLATARASSNLRDATVMLQREVADRLAAPVGTKAYGVLTIFVGAQATAERLLVLPPGAFRPPPKVQSAVVRLTFKPSAVPAHLERIFERMVKTIFMQRRKTLLNALRPYADSVGIQPVHALTDAGIDPSRRPETLTQPELLQLAQRLKPESLKPKAYKIDLCYSLRGISRLRRSVPAGGGWTRSLLRRPPRRALRHGQRSSGWTTSIWHTHSN